MCSVICEGLGWDIQVKPLGNVIEACTSYFPKQEESEKIAIFLLLTQILKDFCFI